MNRKSWNTKRAMRRWRAFDALGALGLARRRTVARRAVDVTALVLAGAVVGAGMAMLFAPSSGRDLRRDIGRRAGDLRQKMRRKAGGKSMDVPEWSEADVA